MADRAITLRQGGLHDLEVAANLLACVRRASFPVIPRSVHDDEVELAPYLASLMDRGAEVVLAEEAGDLVGVMVVHGTVIEQLAIAVEAQAKGIGRQLIHFALEQSTQPMTLWTFQSNVKAQGFYLHLGFTEIARTDGDNEEGEPDVCFQSPANRRRLRRR